MARERTQKKISTRIDRSYYKRPHPWRRMRRSLVFLASAAAIVLIGLFQARGHGDFINNPGHLTASHASFENDCAKCHDGAESHGKWTGNFSKAVSDAACLKCHDAAVHHENQATFVMQDKNHPGNARSANCTSCHTEHRGQAALITSNDMQCTSCRVDLNNGKVKKSLPTNDPRVHVTAFTMAGHPRFGSNLRTGGAPDSPRIDPTVLRFNHKKHLQSALKGAQRDCTSCHGASVDSSADLSWEDGKSAFAMPGGSTRPSPAALLDGTGRHRSLAQVSFSANCESCHHLGKLANSDMDIVHGDVSLIRKQIIIYLNDPSGSARNISPDQPKTSPKSLNDRLLANLDPGDGASVRAAQDYELLTYGVRTKPLTPVDASALPPVTLPADLYTVLKAELGKIYKPSSKKKEKDLAIQSLDATTRPSEPTGVIRHTTIVALRDAVSKKYQGQEQTDNLARFDAAFARFDIETPDPRLLLYQAVNDNCIKCHDTAGNPGAIPQDWAAFVKAKPFGAGLLAPAKPLKRPAIKRDDLTHEFATAPTGIPAGPRKWYVNSEFNHDAHRSMNCVECHAAAINSELTSDVLSPDIEWQGYKPDASGHLVAQARSCIECHHPENEQGLGASANCTECHTYHDRSKERPADPAPAEILDGATAPKPQVAAAKP